MNNANNSVATRTNTAARLVGAEFGVKMSEGTLDLCLTGSVTVRVADVDTAEMVEAFFLSLDLDLDTDDVSLTTLSDGTYRVAASL